MRLLVLIATVSIALNPAAVRADFGDATFPEDALKGGNKSYHDAWCMRIKNECRVRFQGPAMWVEGQGGIFSDQYLGFRYDSDGNSYAGGEFYNYLRYKSRDGGENEALFLFTNQKAQRNFIRALFRWKRADMNPYPNFRLPASQGPQDTQGRDKSYGVPMNPYERPPITDWNEKTTP